MMRLSEPLAVFYRPEMSVADNPSFSPSAGKPALVVADWIAHDLPIELHTFEPSAVADFYRAHDRRYVDGIFSGAQPNGFGNNSPAVADACRYTAGSLWAAAQHAMTCPDGVACSPSSGFHHAGFKRNHGFCTFNALALVALRLADEGKRTVILDCDRHPGDGTADILAQRGNNKVRHLIAHYSVGIELDDESPTGFHAWLRNALAAAAGFKPDLLLYQAGADMAEGDALGGFLPRQSMMDRDREVFYRTGAAGIPVAWNLAGGYRRDAQGTIAPVLQTHRDTLTELLECGFGEGDGDADVPLTRARLMAHVRGVQ